MKRSKILIPTLSALAVTPAIALVGCGNQDSSEQSILDAIFNPVDAKATKITSFKDEFDKLSIEDQKKELIYGTFGKMNFDFPNKGKKINIRELYKANEGAFKINITKCNITKENDKFYGTLLGYVSYVFEKEHTISYGTQDLILKPNDFIMYTFDFVNAYMNINENNYSYAWEPKVESDLGILKVKYNGGTEEFFETFDEVDTNEWDIKNSHNWVK